MPSPPRLAAILALLTVTACSRPADPPAALVRHDADMRAADTAPPPGPIDSAALAGFTRDYLSAPAARPVFDKYLPVLGAPPMLAFLGRQYPSCHVPAHELGKAVFAARKNLGAALHECGSSCTSGCMHGVVSEAFGNEQFATLVAGMNTFCQASDVARLYKPGNCAHALGHALMLITGGDVRRSIDGCLGFVQTQMAYYCAGGVYMERLLTGPHPTWSPSAVLAPCDSEMLFPAACYRYKGPALIAAYGGHERAVAACLRLDEPQRRGCFHGLGYAAMAAVYEQPGRLARACAHGDRADRIACIEGTIEKVADVNEPRARAACDSVAANLRSVCTDAVDRKMYELDKPTFPLYYDSAAVAERRGALMDTAKTAASGAGTDD